MPDQVPNSQAIQITRRKYWLHVLGGYFADPAPLRQGVVIGVSKYRHYLKKNYNIDGFKNWKKINKMAYLV